MAQRKEIAFQGEYGAFSEQAALAFFGSGCTPVPRENFRDVFQDVLKKKVHAGIVPVENSLFGSVHQNFDLLQEYPLKIVGEVKLRIRMNLMALPDTSIKDVRDVFSHPQALGQSDRYLRTLKNVTLHQFYDTAGAAKMIAEKGKKNAAAIASLQAAEHYQLKVLKKGIETDRQNFTRFVVLSRTAVRPKRHAKTSLIFATKHAPGSLVQCLSLFADRGVNLLKIESRPIIGKPWEYLFFVDVASGQHDPRLASALRSLKGLTSSMKILGSYEVGKVVR
jgi:prephenate dehydratase